MKKEVKEFLIDLVNKELEQEYMYVKDMIESCERSGTEPEPTLRDDLKMLIQAKAELLKYRNQMGFVESYVISLDIDKYLKDK